MAEKNLNARIIHKHDTETNWLKATSFIPKQGEIIVYDIDTTYNYERFKIGDGATNVNSLPFADDTKVDKVSGKGLSTNDYTTTEKNKLAGIASGANKTVVDSSLSTSSTNPVQNKVISAAINSLNTLVGDESVSTQISTAIANKSDTGHTHNYAGSSSAGGAANSVKTNMVVKLNGGSTEGTNLFTYNGSTAKTVNITPSAIGAAASSHGNHVPATETANNAKFLRNDNTWQTVTPANIGALSTSGGTIAGDLYLGDGTNTSQYDLYIRRTVDEVQKSGRLYWGTGGVFRLQAASDGTIFNYLDLQSDSTDFKQPVSISSGGTGATDAATARTNLEITPANIGAADKTELPQIATASSDDGVAFTATVSGITALKAGMSFVMIPGRASASTTPTLNVNGLGAKNLRRRLSSGATVVAGYTTTWLTKNKPYRVMYDGSAWVVEGHNKPVAADLYGSVLPTVASVTLTAANWTGTESPYSQTVVISGTTSNSKIDLQPTVAQIVELQSAGTALMTGNDSGTITAYAIGTKPTSDYTIQVTITETTT